MTARTLRRLVPAPLRPFAAQLRDAVPKARAAAFGGYLRHRSPGDVVRIAGASMRINDGPNAAVLYEDIFLRGVYHFHPVRPDPLILDGGANIGMSALYFQRLCPGARIVAFEPDPAIYPYLAENVRRNGLDGVEPLQQAVAATEGTLPFWSDGKYAAAIADYVDEPPPGWSRVEVPAVPLRNYLDQPVDFLKLNIEGAEYDVLTAAADRLHMVRELVVEYHHLPGLPRTLHRILALLDEVGFTYAVSDFGASTYAGARSPIRLDSATRYYRHIYAVRNR